MLPPNKAANTRPGVQEIFRNRWSPRAFSDKAVAKDLLLDVLDAARWAASSYNEQPWRFIVATKADGALYEKMLSVLVPFNQMWAKAAPVLIITVTRKTFSHNNHPNAYAVHDVGAALAYMMLQASASGLHAHAMAGFDHAAARTVLEVPDDYDLGAAVVIGYLGEPDTLPDDQMKQQEMAPRQRKPLSELVFTGKFGAPMAGA